MLMDQRRVAGVGNIYANEALFAAGVDPVARADHVQPDEDAPAPRRGWYGSLGGDRVQRHDVPRLPHRHGRARQLPAGALRLRAGGRALQGLRHSAHRNASHRRTDFRALPSLPVVSPRPGAAPAASRRGPRRPQGSGAGARGEPAGGVPDGRRDGQGPVRWEGQATPQPSAELLPRGVSRRQGRPDPLRGARRRVGLCPERVRRLPHRVASNPPVPSPLQSETQPDPARRLREAVGGPAPRITSGSTIGGDDARCYGPFRSFGRTAEAVRTLADLLGLRDCAASMPIVFAGQGDLFEQARRAACMRHEFGVCAGPCAGFVAESDDPRRWTW